MCLAQGPQRSDAGEARTRYPSVIDKVNILKISVKSKHQFTAHLCTLTILTLIAYTCKLRFNVKHVRKYFVT